MPARVQRRRIKGWRAPVGAKYVGRGTRWGNPWVVVQTRTGWAVNWVGSAGQHPPNGVYSATCADRPAAHEKAVACYRDWLSTRPDLAKRARRELAGRDLMCWCAPDLRCHVDVLLELANRPV